jgi:hypothetical protein
VIRAIRLWPSAILAAAAMLIVTLSVGGPPVHAQVPGNPPTSESDSCAGGVDLFAQAICSIALSGPGGNPVNDGIVVVRLTSPGNGVTLGCDGPSDAPAAGACGVAATGQEVDIPCGSTAGSATAALQNSSCNVANFTIQSALGGCITPATSACPVKPNLNANSATVQISFLATPGNAGSSSVLGIDSINFQGPPVGTLLVTATPQLIPSNGTVGSVITATFACGQGINANNGFPLSSNGVAGDTTNVNQPILGPGPYSGRSAVCGAGLPGGFTFVAPRNNILFDNGRNSESIGCGVGPTVSPFGGATPFTPYRSTAPLAFTCTGAAVMATGNGVAGNAAINVTYASAVGGLTAIGSTLLTIAPSSEPKVAVACSPATINPSGPGSVCRATVTDQNGIPMGGVSNPTVTFSTSDSGRTLVEPCGHGVPGAINVTTSPAIIPQVSPFAPCQLPSTFLPGQVATFVNGQASAIVIPLPGAAPGPVTISASLNVEIPPSSACLVAPYVPSPFLGVQLGLPAVSGCGTANPVGFTGFATALPAVTGTLIASESYTPFESPSGSATVTISSTTGIQVAGATATSPLQLVRGCSQIVVTSPQGTPTTSIAAQVSPAISVVSIWRYNNTTKFFSAGFFGDPAVPTDFTNSGPPTPTGPNNPAMSGSTAMVTESYFVCMAQSGTILGTNQDVTLLSPLISPSAA